MLLETPDVAPPPARYRTGTAGPVPTLPDRHGTPAPAPLPEAAAVEATLDAAMRALRRGLADDACKALEQLARQWPSLARVRAHLGLVHRHAARLDDAVRELEEATRLAPEHAGYHNQLGLTYRMLGYLEQARRAYERAIELDGYHAGALINLGLLHDRYFDQPARAAELYVRGAALLPTDATMVIRWLNDVMLRSGHRDRRDPLVREGRGVSGAGPRASAAHAGSTRSTGATDPAQAAGGD